MPTFTGPEMAPHPVGPEEHTVSRGRVPLARRRRAAMVKRCAISPASTVALLQAWGRTDRSGRRVIARLVPAVALSRHQSTPRTGEAESLEVRLRRLGSKA